MPWFRANKYGRKMYQTRDNNNMCVNTVNLIVIYIYIYIYIYICVWFPRFSRICPHLICLISMLYARPNLSNPPSLSSPCNIQYTFKNNQKYMQFIYLTTYVSIALSAYLLTRGPSMCTSTQDCRKKTQLYIYNIYIYISLSIVSICLAIHLCIVLIVSNLI